MTVAPPLAATVEMPGIRAAVVAIALLGAGALAFALGLLGALVLVRRPLGRRRALGVALLGAILAGTGAGLVWLVDHGPTDPDLMDLASFPLAGAALAAGLLAAWRVGRRRAAPDAPPSPPPSPTEGGSG